MVQSEDRALQQSLEALLQLRAAQGLVLKEAMTNLAYVAHPE